MKDLIIAANWKSNKTKSESKEWLDEFVELIKNENVSENKVVILFTPFTLLNFIDDFIKENNLKIYLGAQDISQFNEGAYTSFITGRQIKEFSSSVLIGHSEVRHYLNQTDDILSEKTNRAQESKLEIIYCVSNLNQPIPLNIKMIAYEPLSAIGTGNAENPENADKICRDFKNKNNMIKYSLYGGSVTSENVNSFTSKDNIDGVLIGGASLDPHEFFQIIKNA